MNTKVIEEKLPYIVCLVPKILEIDLQDSAETNFLEQKI
jgi:hypothetical protein